MWKGTSLFILFLVLKPFYVWTLEILYRLLTWEQESCKRQSSLGSVYFYASTGFTLSWTAISISFFYSKLSKHTGERTRCRVTSLCDKPVFWKWDFERKQKSKRAWLVGSSRTGHRSTGSANKSNISFCLLQLHHCFVTVCSLALYVICVLCVHNTM